MQSLIEACSTTRSQGATSINSSSTFAAIGELMFQSHSGYQQCGLASAGTDKLVMLAREQLLENSGTGSSSVFGAKITGGGSGGSVCMAASDDDSGKAAILWIAAKYAKATQHKPILVSGSSPGAQYFDHIVLQLSSSLNGG